MAFDLENAIEVKDKPAEFNLANAEVVDTQEQQALVTGDYERYVEEADDIHKWVSTEEQRSRWKEQGKIGWTEIATRQNTLDLLPFVNVFSKGKRSLGLWNTVQRLQKNEYKDVKARQTDMSTVTDYAMKVDEERTRGVSWQGKTYRMLSEMPSFMLEFIATGGLAAAGKAVVKKTATKLIGESVEKGVKKAVVKGVGVAVGAAARSTAMPGRYVPKYGEIMVNSSLAITDKGIKILDEAQEKPAVAALKAFGDIWIENLSEDLGKEVFKPMGASIYRRASKRLPKEFVEKLGTELRKIKPKGGISRTLTKAGYDGVIEEYGEERAGDLLRAFTGVDDRDISLFHKTTQALFPETEDALVELGVFSIVGGGSVASQSIRNKMRKRKIAEDVINQTMDNMSETEKDVLLKEMEANQDPIGIGNISDDVSLKEESNFDKFYTSIFNRLAPIERLTKEAEKRGIKLDPGQDPLLLARQYLGIGPAIKSTLEDSTFRINEAGEVEVTGEGMKPVLDSFDVAASTIEPNKETRRDDLQKFLIAQRLMEDLASREDVEVSEGQKDQAVKDMIELSQKYGEADGLLSNTAERLYGYQRRVLELLVDSGHLSQDQFDGILENNQHYIPFDRVLPDAGLELPVAPGGKAKFAKTNVPIKKIKGSELEIENVYESMIKNTVNIMDRALRNKVAKSIASLTDVLPEFVQERTFKKKKDTKSEDGGEIAEEEIPTALKPKGNVIEFFEDGKRKFVEVSSGLFDAMTGISEQQLDLFAKILSVPATTLRVGATITPEFFARNFIRDQFTAVIQSNVGFRPFIDSAFGIAHVIGKSDVYYDWLRTGGAYSGIVETNRDSLKSAYEELSGKPSVLKKLNIITTLQDISQVVEQGTRVGLFDAAKRSGLSGLEAGFESREGTLDFGVKGSKTKNINAVKAFLNAQIQAFDKTIQTFKKDPVSTTLKGMAWITTPSVLLYLINRNDPEYAELPQWQKDLFWNIHVKDQWFRIPKPFGWGQIFGTMPERFMEYADSKDASSFDGLARSIYESLSPMAGADAIIPTAFAPIIENIANFSFFRGRSVVPLSKEKLLPGFQASAYTSETAKILGQKLNYSPLKIENLIRGYTGTSGGYILEASDFLVDSIRESSGEKTIEPPKELSDMPVIRGFTTRSPRGFRSQSVRDFFDLYSDVKAIRDTASLIRKENPKKYREFQLQNRAKLGAVKEMSKKYKAMSNINKSVQRINKSSLPDEDKRKAIKEKEKRITQIAQETMNSMKERFKRISVK